MKNFFISALLILLNIGCSKIDVSPQNEIVLINKSNFTVKVKSSSTFFTEGNFPITSISPNSQVIVKIKSSVGTSPEVINENGLLSDVDEEKIGSIYHYNIYAFEYLVEYKVSGTAKTVDLTLANEKNGTDQLDNVSLPWNRGYKTWEKKFVYVSAQNQGQTGNVSSKIFYRGVELFSSESSGAFVIAKASGSLPD